MRVWMEYDEGYVNIDDDFIYFSDSGNWGSVQKLNEIENVGSIFLRGRQISFFVIILAIAISNGLISASIVAAIWGAFSFYGKMWPTFKKDIGIQFKVPLEKIIEISWDEDAVDFLFYNAVDKKQLFQAFGIKKADLAHFMSLSELIQSNK